MRVSPRRLSVSLPALYRLVGSERASIPVQAVSVRPASPQRSGLVGAHGAETFPEPLSRRCRRSTRYVRFCSRGSAILADINPLSGAMPTASVVATPRRRRQTQLMSDTDARRHLSIIYRPPGMRSSPYFAKPKWCARIRRPSLSRSIATARACFSSFRYDTMYPIRSGSSPSSTMLSTTRPK